MNTDSHGWLTAEAVVPCAPIIVIMVLILIPARATDFDTALHAIRVHPRPSAGMVFRLLCGLGASA